MKCSTYLFVAVLLFASCNRGGGDFENILASYQDEPTKLSAAKFLLDNVNHYYTTDNRDLLDFYPFLDSLSLSDVTYHEEKKMLNNFFRSNGQIW